MNRSLASAFLVVAAATLTSACSVTRPAPVRQMYLLEPPPAAAVTPANPKSARIGAVTVSAAFQDRVFVVREADLRFETDFYRQWVVGPGAMIGEATARSLSQSGVFARVISPGAPPEADFTIDAFVGEFYADNRDPKAPAAVLAITYYVTRADRGLAPVWSKSYARRAAMTPGSGEGYAAAQSRLLGEILAELARDLAAAPQLR
jgi:ABC-type uncharacterized transport system auxiliary subunit